MNLTIVLVAKKAEVIEVTDQPLSWVLDMILTHWMEDEERNTYVVTDERGETVAIVIRDKEDAEIAHTVYADGARQSHRCHYVLRADGGYDFTHVEMLGYGQCWRDTRGLGGCRMV